MALYLNNAQYGSGNQSSQDTLIHSYNKFFFSDYNHAKTVLLQKDMKPGEVTFAYYYDLKVPYGQNVIFAVGPLSETGCNTIFKNADEIDSVKDVLDETIADINASVSNMETKVDGIIEECRNPLLKKIEKNSNDIVSIKRDISTIKSDIVNTNDTLTSKINQVNNQLIAQMSKDKTILINKINDTSNDIVKYIDNTSNAIINYINRSVSLAVDNVTTDYTQKNDDTSMTLSDAISTLKLNLEQSISDLSGKHDRDITDLQRIIDEAKGKVTENTTKLSQYIQQNNSSLIKLNTSINNVNNTLDERITNLRYDFEALEIPKKIHDLSTSIATVTTQSNVDHEKLKAIDNLDSRLSTCEGRYEKHFKMDIVRLNGNIADINTSISKIIETIDNIKIQTGTSEGTVQDKFDNINSQLFNISERLSRIDSSINALETKFAGNETYHNELLNELSSYKNSLDY